MSQDAKDQEKAAEVFRDTIALVEEGSFNYAVGGGLSTDHWTGGAERIADIDLFIREEDAPRILEHLRTNGYEITETEHSWLHKAFRDDVTIDLMFELKNDVRFDDGIKEHLQRGEMFGTTAFVIAPEDQVAALAGALDRETIDNWYDIIDILANNDVDWDYLIERSRAIPLRMLSVVYFASAERVPVQKGVAERLLELVAQFRS